MTQIIWVYRGPKEFQECTCGVDVLKAPDQVDFVCKVTTSMFDKNIYTYQTKVSKKNNITKFNVSIEFFR